jgi:hypothetical protein
MPSVRCIAMKGAGVWPRRPHHPSGRSEAKRPSRPYSGYSSENWNGVQRRIDLPSPQSLGEWQTVGMAMAPFGLFEWGTGYRILRPKTGCTVSHRTVLGDGGLPRQRSPLIARSRLTKSASTRIHHSPRVRVVTCRGTRTQRNFMGVLVGNRLFSRTVPARTAPSEVTTGAADSTPGAAEGMYVTVRGV